jgi:hypothetical protein
MEIKEISENFMEIIKDKKNDRIDKTEFYALAAKYGFDAVKNKLTPCMQNYVEAVEKHKSLESGPFGTKPFSQAVKKYVKNKEYMRNRKKI